LTQMFVVLPTAPQMSYYGRLGLQQGCACVGFLLCVTFTIFTHCSAFV